jgi:hypothetical protein
MGSTAITPNERAKAFLACSVPSDRHSIARFTVFGAAEWPPIVIQYDESNDFDVHRRKRDDLPQVESPKEENGQH